jgi:hypothetical protein
MDAPPRSDAIGRKAGGWRIVAPGGEAVNFGARSQPPVGSRTTPEAPYFPRDAPVTAGDSPRGRCP